MADVFWEPPRRALSFLPHADRASSTSSSRPRRVRASPSLSSRRQPWGVSNAIGRLVFAVAARPPVTVPAADVGDDDGDDGDDDGGDDAQRDRPSSASPPASPAAGSLVAAQTSWTAGGDVGDVPEFPGGLPGKPPTRKILSNRFPLFGSSQQQLPAYQNPTQTTPMGLFVRVFRRSSFLSFRSPSLVSLTTLPPSH